MGFPDSSVGKESVCNGGDPGLIPGLGRSAGDGIGYPLQYSWASLVTQLVKNLPAMWETWVWSLNWEGPLGKGKAIHSSVLAWRIPWTVLSMGLQRVGRDSVTFTFTLTIWTFVGKLMSLLFHTLSRFVIVFLPRRKHLLILWLESLSSVILEPEEIKS